jgi:hypothetical protein
MQVQDGNYTLSTVEDQMKYAQFLMDKRLVSNTFKEPSQLIVAIQLCKDLGLPNSCLKDFYVIGGRPAIYGDTFVALALGSGVVQDHKVVFFDEEGVVIDMPKKGKKYFGCKVSIKRKGSDSYIDATYTFDDKENARNNNENFIKYPIDMLFRRAMGRAVKWACADAIRGVELADYAEDAERKLEEKDKADLATKEFS